MTLADASGLVCVWGAGAWVIDDMLLEHDPRGPWLLRAVFSLCWPIIVPLAFACDVIDRLRK